MTDRAPVLLYNSQHPQYDKSAHVVDVPELLKSKLLITGGSGSGKSRALRALLEQLAGQLQIIVFDFEGDLVTLTAVHPFLVAGDGGHVPAHPEQASALASRIMAIGASLICNLSELSLEDRRSFVAEFLGAMMAIPREQWRPCLIAIDEVQLVCPERTDGDPISAAAVVDVAARGRKRGFCLVVTSQRVAKVRKDLVAECHNRLFGFITLPADIALASKELGLEGRARAELKALPRGEFFAIGPAFSRETIRVRNADVITREPESGTAHALPRSESVAALLEQLGELPSIQSTPSIETGLGRIEFVPDPQWIEELRDKRAQLAAFEHQRVLTRQWMEALYRTVGEGLGLVGPGATIEVDWEAVLERAEGPSADARTILEPFHPETDSGNSHAPLKEAAGVGPSLQSEPAATPSPFNATMRRMLAVLVQLHSIQVERVSPTLLAGWVGMSQSGTFSGYLKTLRAAGAIESLKEGIRITDVGRPHAAPEPPFKSRAQLHQHWIAKLGKTPAAMLRELIIAHPKTVERTHLAKLVGVSAGSGTYAGYLKELRTPGLIAVEAGNVRCTELLFPRGLR